jgi:hypothetical protein
MFRLVSPLIKTWKYDLARCIDFPGGCVQQYASHWTLHDGTEVTLFMCGVFQIEGGRILRLDEYYDSSAVQAVMAGVA